MVRTITKPEKKLAAQWSAAWLLLPPEWRAAIARFIISTDPDIAEAIGKI